jgi:hypothetical protein
MDIFSAIRHNLAGNMTATKDTLERRIQKIKQQSVSWETYARVLYRNNTMSVANPIAAAKPLLRSSMARITKSVLSVMEKAPASSSENKMCGKFNSSWKTIVNSDSSSMSGSRCQRSYRACAFAKNGKRRGKSKGENHDFPSKLAATINSNRKFIHGPPVNKGPNEFRDRN